MVKRSFLFILLGIIILVGILSSVAAFWLYRQYQSARWKVEAQAAFRDQRWTECIRKYGFYLSRVPNDIPALFEYAEANLHQVQARREALQNAAIAYHQVLRFDPENKNAEDYLLQVYEKMQNWHTLEYYAREFLQHRKDDPQLLFYIAYALQQMGRHHAAITAYQNLLAVQPNHKDAYEALLYILRVENQLPQATALIDEACSRFPEDYTLQAIRLRFLMDVHGPEFIQSALEQLVQSAPDETRIIQLQAEWALKKTNWQLAARYLERLLEKKPQDPETILLLSQTYSHMDKMDEAIQLIQKQPLLLLVDNPQLWLTLGDFLAITARWDELDKTIVSFQEALPEQKPLADYLRARELLAKGNPAAAIELLNVVKRQRPYFLPAHYYLVIAYLAIGDESLARSTLEAYLNRNPGDERARMLLSLTSPKEITLEDKVKRARELLERGPFLADLLTQMASEVFRLAWATQKTKEYLELITKLFEKALELRPQYTRAYEGLVESYALMNFFDQARQYIANAEKAGVDKTAVLRLRTYVALAQNNIAEADQCFEEFLALSTPSLNDIKLWRDLYSRWGFPDSAKNILKKTFEKVEPPLRMPLEIEWAELVLSSDNLDEAILWIEQNLPPKTQEKELIQRMDTIFLKTAILILEKNISNYQKYVQDIFAYFQQKQPESDKTQLLKAFSLLHQSPPEVLEAKRICKNISITDDTRFAHDLLLARCALFHDDLNATRHYLESVANQFDKGTEQLKLELVHRLLDFGRTQDASQFVQEFYVQPKTSPESLLVIARTASLLRNAEMLQQTRQRISNSILPSEDWTNRNLVLEAMESATKGDTKSAVEILEKLSPQQITDFQTLRLVADTYLMLDQGLKAEQTIKDAINQEKGKSIEKELLLATYQFRQKTPETLSRCVSTLSQLLLRDPRNIPALRLMSESLLARQESGQTLAICDRLLSLDPSDSGAWFTKAKALAIVPGRYSAAVEAVSKAITILPLPEFYYFRGSLHLEQRAYQDAQKDLEMAIRSITQPSATLQLRLAYVYTQTGEKNLAENMLKSAIETATKTGETMDKDLQTQIEQELKK